LGVAGCFGEFAELRPGEAAGADVALTHEGMSPSPRMYGASGPAGRLSRVADRCNFRRHEDGRPRPFDRMLARERNDRVFRPLVKASIPVRCAFGPCFGPETIWGSRAERAPYISPRYCLTKSTCALGHSAVTSVKLFSDILTLPPFGHERRHWQTVFICDTLIASARPRRRQRNN